MTAAVCTRRVMSLCHTLASRLATNARYISRDAIAGSLAPRPSRLAPLHQCEIHLALRYCQAPLASRLAPHLSRLAPLHQCEIHLARRHCRVPRASPLAPRASPPMRDTSRATPWSGPSRLSTNARYISRYAMVGTLAPRASPLTPRLSTNARYISRDAIAGTLAPRAPLPSRLLTDTSARRRSADRRN
ncbi:MAG: hypothetical protein KatS3mg058_4646 [Roseiflexus sp.]|nr:MAG: hypothetical protein KatS3mg058_4646 [Roseiflexus sp.]